MKKMIRFVTVINGFVQTVLRIASQYAYLLTYIKIYTICIEFELPEFPLQNHLYFIVITMIIFYSLHFNKQLFSSSNCNVISGMIKYKLVVMNQLDNYYMKISSLLFK